MSTIERFLAIASQERFRGWPLVGEYTLGPKVPFFGQVLEYDLRTGRGVEHYASLLRYFGWVVVFGVTREGNVITNIQWKPGINAVEWGLSPGGIGKVSPDAPMEEVLQKTKEFFLRETGHAGGEWVYLGATNVESGKFRGVGADGHGLPAHMYLALDLEKAAEPEPNANEIMDKLHVPLAEFWDVLDHEPRLFNEVSAVACAYAAMRALQKMGRV